MKSLDAMIEEVHDLNVDKGWFETDRTFGDGIALLHSEVSEALDYFREIGLQARTNPPKEGETVGKPTDVGSEYADILIRLFDDCYRNNIDLYVEYERKMEYNRTRPYRHGGKAL